VIARVLAARPERIAFVVGGVLSHDRHAWNLKREIPEAREFDEQALRALEAGAWDTLGMFEPRVRERAQPEAELRHFEVLRGFLGSDRPGVVRCYEPSPGVGSALVEFDLTVADEAETAPQSAG
jgi:aromatic ring-opening dioxygenase catalytic subunit (LigB family)